MADEVRTLLMEEARRLLVRQEADLDTLRGRVTNVIGASSIVAAVFGAGLPDDRSGFTEGLSIVALVFFAATVGVCIFVYWPRGWDFSQDLGEWLRRVDDDDDSLTEETVLLGFALNFQDFRVRNRDVLERLQRWFALACAYLAIQVVAWALAVVFG